MTQIKKIISVALVNYTQAAPDGTTTEATLFVPIVDPAQVADLPNLDVVGRIVGNERLETADVAPYLDYVAKLEADIIAQAGATLTPEELEEARNEGYNTLLGTISGQFEAEAKAATEQPAVETPEGAPTPEEAAQVVEEAAAQGNEVAQAIQTLPAAQKADATMAFTQLASVMQFGAEGINHVVARRKLKAQEEALETEYLAKLANMLQQAPAEIQSQMQAALPAEVPAA